MINTAERLLSTLRGAVLAAVTTISLTAACTTDYQQKDACGGQINFFAAPPSLQPGTKTAFSGNSTSGREALYWNKGDRMTILMTNQQGNETRDYIVETASATGNQSNAKVSAVGGNSLQWGAGRHEFTAWYPSLDVFGDDDIFQYADGGLIKNDITVKQSVNLASAQLVIPTFRKDTLQGNVFAPDMRYAWMLAQRSTDAGAETVNLDFVPAFNCFHITLKAGETPLAINQVRVNSDGRDLTGKFTLDKTTVKATAKYLGHERYSAVKTENADGSDYVLAAGQTLEVTIFTIPDDFEDCSIQVLGDFKGDGTLVTKKLDLKDGSGNGVKIKAGNKYNITVAIPDMVEIDAEEDFIEWAPQPLTPAGYVFSVSDTKKVRFTTANLAYMGATGGDKPWRIMQYPWSLIEGTDGSNTFTPGENIDFALFGWATSGYQGKNPWMYSSDPAGYGPATDGLWTADSELWDWGVFNTIYDCSALSAVPNLRTLSFAEWDHLLNQRSGTYRFQCASVNATKGLIVFPDGFTPASCPELVQNITTSLCNVPQDFSQVSYSTSQFSQLSNLGAVFLPVTGARNGTNLLPVHGRFFGQPDGFYWTCTGVIESGSNYGAFCLVFDNNDIAPYEGDDYYPRDCGAAVRLVQDIPSFGNLTPAGKSFTVSADGRKVQFTTSNLMYAGASDPDPKTGKGKFKLMEKPWAYVEGAKGRSSEGATSANQDAGLFGWATSGYQGKNPWMTATRGYAYGPAITSGSWTADSDLWDWGQYNTIYASDGETVLSGLRTLTYDEFQYLLTGRSDSYRFIGVNVQLENNDYGSDGDGVVPGLLIAPDGANPDDPALYHPAGYIASTYWNGGSDGGSGSSSGSSSGSDVIEISENINYIDMPESELETFLAAGYVFLPASGYIGVWLATEEYILGVNNSPKKGYYYTSTGIGSGNARNIYFTSTRVSSYIYYGRHIRGSVRLVKEITD